MKTSFLPLALALALLAAAGCATQQYTTPRVSLHTTRHTGAASLDRPSVHQFTRAETIGIVVVIPRGCGYGEQTGTLRVSNTAAGLTVHTVSGKMREDRTYEYSLPNPGQGGYMVELFYEGEDVAAATSVFVVH